MVSIERFANRFKYFIICLGIVVFFNLYLLYSLAYDNRKKSRIEDDKVTVVGSAQYGSAAQFMQNTTFGASKSIFSALKHVPNFFNGISFSKSYQHNFSALLLNESGDKDVWETAASWVTPEQITPKFTGALPRILQALETRRIKSADIISKGTQLKLFLTYEGDQKVLFKPKWFEREKIIYGKVYGGNDRHNGEIAAFHLSRILGLNRAPIVSGRILNLKEEILPFATYDLSRTFYKNGTNTCFYGVCLYCKPSNGVCADGDLLEGSVTLWLPENMKLARLRHPWQRSYSSSPATWELYSDYCSVIQKSKMYKYEYRLLDLVEIAAFDFLIGNGDRHHYEMFNSKGNRALLIDNGKSFGNPHADFIDVLAPLYQCCRVREEFVSVLSSLRDGLLSYWLEMLLSTNPLSPILTKAHLKALDRRLEIILAAIISCMNEKGESEVLVVE